jgi:prepilin-type N-terminal cleavage/methylation domain-containing protein
VAERGFSLIEVLVAMALLAVGSLALARTAVQALTTTAAAGTGEWALDATCEALEASRAVGAVPAPEPWRSDFERHWVGFYGQPPAPFALEWVLEPAAGQWQARTSGRGIAIALEARP